MARREDLNAACACPCRRSRRLLHRFAGARLQQPTRPWSLSRLPQYLPPAGAVLERARGSVSVRLVQDAFNTRSVALYASLGFEVKEPLLLMRGTPRSKPLLGLTVRSLTPEDISACADLCASVHGYERSNELRNAIRAFTPFVVEREGGITGYMSAATFWIMNHGVAETEED